MTVRQVQADILVQDGILMIQITGCMSTEVKKTLNGF